MTPRCISARAVSTQTHPDSLSNPAHNDPALNYRQTGAATPLLLIARCDSNGTAVRHACLSVIRSIP
jgi:hypothetical protein